MTVTINGTEGVTLNNGTADGPQLTLSSSGYSNWNLDNYSGRFRGYYGSTEYFTVDASGNMGIGTSSPSSRLQVSNSASGLAELQLASDVRAFGIGTGGSTSGYGANALYIYDKTANAERARIDSSGNLLVGTTSNGGLSGNIVCPGIYNRTSAVAANMGIDAAYGMFRSTSALKYKQDVRDLESMDIGLLRPVRYKSKCEGDDQTKDYLGLIADEAAEAGFEELVTRGAEGEIEGFQYERLTVVLLKAIQELKAELDATKAEVAALKGQQA